MKNPNKILHNLQIKIVCPKMNFKDGPVESAKDQIRTLGCAIDWAERNLSGRWHIGEDGQLIRGFNHEVSSLMEGEIDADINISEIINLKDALEEDTREPLYDFPDIDFEGGGNHRLKVVNKKLYIKGFHEAWKANLSQTSLP